MDTDAAPPTLTERVLGRLGGPRWLWIAMWAAVPLVSLLVYTTAIRLTGHALGVHEFFDLLATQAVLAYACLVLLLGVAVLARKAAVVRRAFPDHPTLFRAIGSVRGPVGLTAIVALVISANGWSRYGPLPPLAALPFVIVYLLPILTFAWVVLAVLLDIDGLGRRPLVLGAFPQDRTLGLEDVGSVASSGLALLLIASAPVLFAGADQPVTFGVSLSIVGVSMSIFLLSMWRIHRQMVKAKEGYVALARGLYADAYAPIRQHPSVKVLEDHSGALRAAQSLDERAHDLLTWPLDEGAVKFVAVIVTSVVTTLIVRALFAAVGF